MKKVRKKFSFDQETHANNVISSYFLRGGIVQTVDGGMHFLVNEDIEKINKILEEFFKKAYFKKR